MNKIKKTFSDWRNATPKRVQWLLLAVAFVVVLVLFTLLLTNNDTRNIDEELYSEPTELMFTPESGQINWADVMVGETEHQVISVTSTRAVKVLSVEPDAVIDGFEHNSNCGNVGEINNTVPCTITIKYAPKTAEAVKPVSLVIEWHDANKPDTMKHVEKYMMVLGANTPPVKEPEPIIIEKIIEVPAQPIVEPEPVVELIATTKPFDTVVERTVSTAEACSEFAFPGYDNSGNQIGWVKPKAGAYYFHPFSDKNCENPTGVYNPDNGIITDIKNSSKKIGTDADHIGYAAVVDGVLPQLSSISPKTSPQTATTNSLKDGYKPSMGRLAKPDENGNLSGNSPWQSMGGFRHANEDVTYGTTGIDNAVISTQPYDRSFVLRQYKPIPATIVSEVRADADVFEKGRPLPVRATVDRNVYSDDGRTIIIPTGTMMLGYVTGEIPGPYKAVGRMQINWYQFIRPDGVEFNFHDGQQPFAGDAQGRVGVPGRGSTDYMEQFFMPMLTAVVPAAVNLIAPVTDAFVNQIDLDNNTVVQSGTVRSSELAKNEIITAWNQVAQKLLVDMMDNTVPPFTIAAGTRITVYSPEDLVVTCTDASKKCYLKAEKKQQNNTRFDYSNLYAAYQTDGKATAVNKDGPDWVGQVRYFATLKCCDGNKPKPNEEGCDAYDYRTLAFYCQSQQYQAINNAKQDAAYQSQQKKFQDTYTVSQTQEGLTGIEGDRAYNEQVLGLTYDDQGYIENPFEKNSNAEAVIEAATTTITCEDGSLPDGNGCCPGEIFTDMGDKGFNCCPAAGGDCFPPIL